MKKALIILILLSSLFSLYGCQEKVTTGNLLDTEVEQVEAVVTGLYKLHPHRGIVVECDGARNIIESEKLYEQYQNKLGSIIICNLIIRTYENKTIYELVYSEEN